MAKLHFFHGVMNSGKSAHLLQTAHNYKSNGWIVHLFSPAINDRDGVGVISSRTGLKVNAEIWNTSKLMSLIEGDDLVHHKTVIIIDEVQFIEQSAINLLTFIADVYNIPVICYGLKNNSNGTLFNDTIVKLLADADDVKEIKTVCFCGKKATHIVRYDKELNRVDHGETVSIGAEEKYISTCRKHAYYDYDTTKLTLRRKQQNA